MGALVSLPLLGASSLATSLFLCATTLLCSALCSLASHSASPLATRVIYAVFLLVNSILSWAATLPYIVNKIIHASLGYINFSCGDGPGCVSFSSVHRLNLALGLLHLLLAAALFNIRSATDPRTRFQNGFWRLKLLAYLALVAANFLLIPDSFFVFYGNHLAIIFSTVFIGIGLVLLVDFAHAWAERCLHKIELEELSGEGDASLYKNLLVGGTLAMYCVTIAITGCMYWFFAHRGCSMNQAAISTNLVLALVVSVMLVHPTVQEHNPHAGLAQLAMVAFYCSYLVFSAVASEPDDKNCNPLVRNRGTRTATVVIGAIILFVAIAYTTFRAATNLALSLVNEDDSDLETIRNEPLPSRDMRYAALQQAVDEGALPQSALQDPELYSLGDGVAPLATTYNYVLFHIIFFLATQYVASLLTVNVVADQVGDFVPVGRTYFASWLKIVSLWLCYVLYGWTLLAPVVLPDRFGIHI